MGKPVKVSITSVILVLFSAYGSPATGQIIFVDHGEVVEIHEGADVDEVRVVEGELRVFGGVVHRVEGLEVDSLILIHGGSIGSVFSDDRLRVSGGTTGSVEVSFQGRLEISGGTVSGDVTVGGRGTIRGGSIGGTLRVGCPYSCFAARATLVGRGLSMENGKITGRLADGTSLGEGLPFDLLPDAELPGEIELVNLKAFRRGDCNGDGRFDISDPIATLLSLFVSGVVPGCQDACDSNDDGNFDVADAISTLRFLFRGGAPPPPPFEECGVDATSDDALSCASSSACGG